MTRDKKKKGRGRGGRGGIRRERGDVEKETRNKAGGIRQGLGQGKGVGNKGGNLAGWKRFQNVPIFFLAQNTLFKSSVRPYCQP